MLIYSGLLWEIERVFKSVNRMWVQVNVVYVVRNVLNEFKITLVYKNE